MKARYYDPFFYLCSDEMPFTIRIRLRMKAPVNGELLSEAANRAIRRYPYFAVQLKEAEGEILTEPNPRPVVVYEGEKARPLGSDGVNRHLTAFSYEGSEISFYISHVLCDGAGSYPYMMTALYEYLCLRHGVTPDPTGIRRVEEPFFEDELGNPYPEERMATARPLYEPPKREFFRLTDGGFVTDRVPTIYRFMLDEAEILRFNHDNDGSPCALLSSLMAKAIWDLHPAEERDIVSAVSFNLRPGLGNRNSYRMLCSALKLRYPATQRGADIARLCTCSRGMVTLQSQPENVLYYARKQREWLEAVGRLPSVSEKRAVAAPRALADATDNTFSVSYVGKMAMGGVEPYLDAIYNETDGSTYQSVFLEVTATNGQFHVNFLQGFSSDVYYRALLRQLTAHGLSYTEEGAAPLDTPKMEWP